MCLTCDYVLTILVIIFTGLLNFNAFSQSKINYSDFENTFETKKSDKNIYQNSEKSTFLITKCVFNFYKKYISSQDSRHCTFYPSCSVYALNSIQKKGIIIGILAAFDRLSRCNTLSPERYPKHESSGLMYDPVGK